MGCLHLSWLVAHWLYDSLLHTTQDKIFHYHSNTTSLRIYKRGREKKSACYQVTPDFSYWNLFRWGGTTAPVHQADTKQGEVLKISGQGISYVWFDIKYTKPVHIKEDKTKPSWQFTCKLGSESDETLNFLHTWSSDCYLISARVDLLTRLINHRPLSSTFTEKVVPSKAILIRTLIS